MTAEVQQRGWGGRYHVLFHGFESKIVLVPRIKFIGKLCRQFSIVHICIIYGRFVNLIEYPGLCIFQANNYPLLI